MEGGFNSVFIFGEIYLKNNNLSKDNFTTKKEP